MEKKRINGHLGHYKAPSLHAQGQDMSLVMLTDETQHEDGSPELMTLPRYQLYLIFEHLCVLGNSLEATLEQGAANSDGLHPFIDALDRVIDQIAAMIVPEE